MNVQRNSSGPSDAHSEAGRSGRKILSTNLTAILKALDWNTPRFKERCGYSSPFLMGVTRGEQNPSLDAVYVLAISLGLLPHNLLDPTFKVPDVHALLNGMLVYSNDDVARLRERVKVNGSPSRSHLAHHLKHLMAQRGLTTTMLFEGSEVAASTINKCLKGDQNVTLDTLESIAQFIGVAPFYLLLPPQE